MLTLQGDSKTVKGEKLGYLTSILYLAPSTMSGVADLCPHASPGCREACLVTAGRASFDPRINEARIRRTKQLVEERDAVMEEICRDVRALVRKCEREGMRPAVRLNGTSDLPWHRLRYQGKTLMEHFPEVVWYDYTKDPGRPFEELPPNYSVTFSRSETNEADALKVLRRGGNVAVVFKGGLPETWNGHPVVNGDESDLRFLDPKGVVVGLKAKGDAKHDKSGFVVTLEVVS